MNPHALQQKYYDFIQYSEKSSLPQHYTGLFRMIQEHLSGYPFWEKSGLYPLRYRLIGKSESESECIRYNKTFGVWLELSFGEGIHYKSIIATCFPLYLPDGSFLIHRHGTKDDPLRIRPIYTFFLKEDYSSNRKKLQENGITPDSVGIQDFVDILEIEIKRILNRLYERKDSMVNGLVDIGCIAGAIDQAVHRVFGNRSLFPTADITNALSNASQAQSISILPLKVHKESLAVVASHKAQPDSPQNQNQPLIGDPVRNLLPVHAGFFCPVETPESKSVGLNLTLTLTCNPDDWNACSSMSLKPTIPTDCPPEAFLGPGAALIPFLHHTDPTRAMMGAKNMKQALPPIEGEPPIILTGLEEKVFGPDDDTSKTGHRLGINVLVGYVPWKGLNYEDGIVISNTVVSKFSTIKRHRIGPYECPPGHVGSNPSYQYRLLDCEGIPIEGLTAQPGDVIAAWEPIDWRPTKPSSSSPKPVTHPERIQTARVPSNVGGRICAVHVQRHPLDRNSFRLMVELEEIRPLEVGDKMMGRHGNKGVVSTILPEKSMPYFLDSTRGRTDLPNGPDDHGERRPHTHLEMLLSPVGVVGRMNLGQLLETHATLALRYNPQCKTVRPDIGRPFAAIDMAGLRQDVLDTGLTDPQGKTILYYSNNFDGVKQLEEPCTVGWQYMMKLNHLARDKKHVRGAKGPISLVTGQPCKGKSRNGGMKLGEMEMWCLLERNAWDILKELIFRNSDPQGQTIQALQDYLRVLGVELVIDREKNGYHFEPFDPDRWLPIDTSIKLRVKNGTTLEPVTQIANEHASNKNPLARTLFDPAIFGPDTLKLRPDDSSLSKGKGAIIPLHVPCWGPGQTVQEEPCLRHVYVLPVRYRKPLWNRTIPTPLMGEVNDLYEGILRDNAKLMAQQEKMDEIQRNRLETLQRWEAKKHLTEKGRVQLERVLDLMTMAHLPQAVLSAEKRKYSFTDDRHVDAMLDHWTFKKIKKVCESIFHESNESIEEWANLVMNISGFSSKSSPLRCYRRLNFRLDQLFRYVQNILKGKKGLFRSHLLGRRMNYSARAVIVPSPTLNLNEIRVPKDIFCTLYPTPSGGEPLSEAWVLMNRPPSLLPTNVQAVLAKPEPNSHVIRIHPGLCEGMGADFDGDQVQLYALHSPQAKIQATTLLRPGAMPFLVKGALALSLNKDALIGLANLDREELSNLARPFGLAVLEDVPPKKWIEDAYRLLSPENREKFGSRCLQACFQKATQRGTSISFFELLDMAPLKRGMEIADGSTLNTEAELKAVLSQSRPIGLAVLCGTGAVKSSQVAQIVIARGDIPLPHQPSTRMRIHSSYAVGLEPDEFFVSAMATREAMIFKKLRTACGGYFTRRLVECGHVFDQLCNDQEDSIGWQNAINRSLRYVEPFRNMVSPIPWGLLAGHSLGEEGTQSAMKVFHTGDVGASGSLHFIEAILAQAPNDMADAMAKLNQLCNAEDWRYPLYTIILQTLFWDRKNLNQVYTTDAYRLLARLSYRFDAKLLQEASKQQHRYTMNNKERLMLNP